jgi:hypothetical protein
MLRSKEREMKSVGFYPSDSSFNIAYIKKTLIFDGCFLYIYVAQVRNSWNQLIGELNEWAIFRKQEMNAENMA